MDCPFTLPPRGQEIYQEVFLAAKDRAASDAQAARQAWRIVKRTYRKKNGMWVIRKDPKPKLTSRGRILKG